VRGGRHGASRAARGVLVARVCQRRRGRDGSVVGAYRLGDARRCGGWCRRGQARARYGGGWQEGPPAVCRRRRLSVNAQRTLPRPMSCVVWAGWIAACRQAAVASQQWCSAAESVRECQRAMPSTLCPRRQEKRERRQYVIIEPYSVHGHRENGGTAPAGGAARMRRCSQNLRTATVRRSWWIEGQHVRRHGKRERAQEESSGNVPSAALMFV